MKQIKQSKEQSNSNIDYPGDYIYNIFDTIDEKFVNEISIKPIRIMIRGIFGLLMILTFLTIFVAIPITIVVIFWKTVGPLPILIIVGIIGLYSLGNMFDKRKLIYNKSNKKHKKEVNQNGGKKNK